MIDIIHKGSNSFFIDNDGRDHHIPLFSTSRYIAEGKFTVKIEGLEKHYKSITHDLGITKKHSVHLYISPKDSKSFPTHTDPIDVFIYVIEGIKTMEVDKSIHTIKAGEYISIPAETPHRAINIHDSTMLSIGIKKPMKKNSK
jgi:quercetin dioxygenase-like cupin family protein